MFSITSLIVHLVSTNRPTANEWVKQVTMLENQPIHKDYENMTIELDGKRFENSRFSGVTFVYKGTKPFIFANNNLEQMIVLKIVEGPQSAGAEFLGGIIGAKCNQIQLRVMFAELNL
jgi:hypothetical protein